MANVKAVRRGRGRPPRTVPVHVVHVRMDEPLWRALEKAARGRGMRASGVLREYAERFVQRYGAA